MQLIPSIFDRFAQKHGVQVDAQAPAYVDLWLRNPSAHLPLPDLRHWYREPGLWVPLSCVVTLIDSRSAVPASNGGTTTQNTTDLDTTGATLIVIGVAARNVAVDATPITDNADGSSNGGFTALTGYGPAPQFGTMYTRLFWKKSPTTSGTHHWSVTTTGDYVSMGVLVFSGTDTTSPLVGETGGVSATASCKPGAITPNAAGDVSVTYVGWAFSDPSILTWTRDKHGGFLPSMGYGIAHYLAPNTSALDPEWTGGAEDATAVHAIFKIASGGGGGSRGLFMTPPLNGLGVGGSFFRDPLQSQAIRKDRIYVPARY